MRVDKYKYHLDKIKFLKYYYLEFGHSLSKILPFGHSQNQPYLLISIASMKNLQT
jgi:hypothetical protein